MHLKIIHTSYNEPTDYVIVSIVGLKIHIQSPSERGEFQACHSFSLQCGFQKKCTFFTFFCEPPVVAGRVLSNRIYLSIPPDIFLELDRFFLTFGIGLDRSCASKAPTFRRKENLNKMRKLGQKRDKMRVFEFTEKSGYYPIILHKSYVWKKFGSWD